MTLEDLREYSFLNNLPLDVNIELTQKCNFLCPHCYCPENKIALTTEQAKKVILKCQKAGVIFVNFTGGEVTLRKDFPEIYRYAREAGCLVSIQTNLSYLSESLKSILITHKPRNISVTIYGTSDDEYRTFTGAKKGYTQLIENLNFLRENSINFNLKAIFTEETKKSAMMGRYDEISREYGKHISWDPIIFGRKDGDISTISHRVSPREIVDFDRLDIEGVNFWDSKVKTRSKQSAIKCGGGISSFSVDSMGLASICSLYVSEKYDFLNQSFSDVWKNLKESNARMQNHYKNSFCSSCDNKSICRWCAAYAVLEHNCSEKPVPFMCALVDERVKRANSDSNNDQIIHRQ